MHRNCDIWRYFSSVKVWECELMFHVRFFFFEIQIVHVKTVCILWTENYINNFQTSWIGFVVRTQWLPLSAIIPAVKSFHIPLRFIRLNFPMQLAFLFYSILWICVLIFAIQYIYWKSPKMSAKPFISTWNQISGKWIEKFVAWLQYNVHQ